MSEYFNEAHSAEVVIERMQACDDARFKAVMEATVRHLHAFVKEVEPSMEEWMQAIRFLTAVGQMCDDKRQEWILASDTLGISMLVETINNRTRNGSTEATVLGPFHVAGAPWLEMGDNICKDGKGEACVVAGVVTDTLDQPIDGVVLDVWQTNGAGLYDVQQPHEQPAMNLRGRFVTGADGAYRLRTVKPVSYPIPDDGPVGQMLARLKRHPYRPAHIHFILEAPGYERVVTHFFAEGDAYLESDAVFGVKSSLIVPFTRSSDEETARAHGIEGPFWEVSFDFKLAKSEHPVVPA
ncbi:MAG: intradiol ring-cleavage dioxygenase [Gammaproteobacteria bacterium]